MLRSLKELSGFVIQATDGEIGTVDDLYFEEETWKIRYVIVDTGRWLPGRRVLLSPVAIGRPDWDNRRLPVSLTRDRVRESPEVEAILPIQRESEVRLHEHYLWEPYWIPGIGATIETLGGTPGYVAPEEAETPEAERQESERQGPHLRGASEMIGYDIEASDGAIGHVWDFLFDEMEWSIRWMVVDTGVWIPGRKVLIPVAWVERVDLPETTVQLDLARQRIEASPDYDPDRPLAPQLEAQILAHYRAA